MVGARAAPGTPRPTGVLGAAARCRSMCLLEEHRGRTRSCGRLSADPDPARPGPPLRRGLLRRLGHARPLQAAHRGQDRAVRMRHRAERRTAHPFPGALLPRRDDLHHLRHRDRLLVPMGGRLPPAAFVRPDRGRRLRGGGVHLLPLPHQQRCAPLGTGQTTRVEAMPPRTSSSTISRISVPTPGRRTRRVVSRHRLVLHGPATAPDDPSVEPGTAPTGPGRAA